MERQWLKMIHIWKQVLIVSAIKIHPLGTLRKFNERLYPIQNFTHFHNIAVIYYTVLQWFICSSFVLFLPFSISLKREVFARSLPASVISLEWIPLNRITGSRWGNTVKVLNAHYLIVFSLQEVLLSPTVDKKVDCVFPKGKWRVNHFWYPSCHW